MSCLAARAMHSIYYFLRKQPSPIAPPLLGRHLVAGAMHTDLFTIALGPPPPAASYFLPCPGGGGSHSYQIGAPHAPQQFGQTPLLQSPLIDQ